MEDADDYPMVEVNYLNQKLDHFDPLNKKTWQQVEFLLYYRSWTHFVPFCII